jgi:hypothetical protein
MDEWGKPGNISLMLWIYFRLLFFIEVSTFITSIPYNEDTVSETSGINSTFPVIFQWLKIGIIPNSSYILALGSLYS